MVQIGSYEAKTHLPELLERVRAGESITITKHGVPVAELVPTSKSGKPDLDRLFNEMVAFRKGRKLRGVTIRELIHEGHKH